MGLDAEWKIMNLGENLAQNGARTKRETQKRLTESTDQAAKRRIGTRGTLEFVPRHLGIRATTNRGTRIIRVLNISLSKKT